MPSDAEERAIEVMRVAIERVGIHVEDVTMSFEVIVDPEDAARAAYAALRAHDAETLNRVVMDSEGNVVRDEGD